MAERGGMEKRELDVNINVDIWGSWWWGCSHEASSMTSDPTPTMGDGKNLSQHVSDMQFFLLKLVYTVYVKF